MAVEIHNQAIADTTAGRPTHEECPGDSSCLAQSHSGSCAGNNELPNSCLDLVLGAINELQQEVLRMRVSCKCKDAKANTEVELPDPRQRIDIFVGLDSGSLVTSMSTDSTRSWSQYVACEGESTSNHDCMFVSLGPERMDKFSSDHLAFSYTESGWESVFVPKYPSFDTSYQPAVVQSSPSGFQLFYVKCDTNEVCHYFGDFRDAAWNWSDESCLGEKQSLAGPVAVSRDRNLVDMFFVSKGGSLYWKSWVDMQWKPKKEYVKLGKACVGSPEAIARHRNRIDVFVLSAEGELMHKSWDGLNWNPPDIGLKTLGGSFASRPALVSRGPLNFDLFIIGKNGKLYHRRFDEDEGGWSPSIGFRDLGGNFDLEIPPTVTLYPGGVDIFLVGGEDTKNGAYHKRWKTGEDPMLSEFEPLCIWDCTSSITPVVQDIEDLEEKKSSPSGD